MAAPDTRRRTMDGKKDERVEEALERLESGVSRILDGEEFKRYLSVAAKFHRYSANNCLLILMQWPDATRVAGYRKWQQMGRQVHKGEKGIKILAPISRKVAEDEETGEAARALVGFKAATVVDISQTDGEPLPEAPHPEDLDPEDPEGTAKKVYDGHSRPARRLHSRVGDLVLEPFIPHQLVRRPAQPIAKHDHDACPS